MNREEYIRILTDQIRCVKARDMVADEIKMHIEDQALSYREQGMKEEQAIEAAVKDMGDPVEVGVSMDRIHRPQISWSMVALMAAIGVVSISLHAVFGSSDPGLGWGYVLKQTMYTLIGFLAMVLVCMMDYSFLADHCVGTALVFLAVVLFSDIFLGKEINGAVRWISVRGLVVGLIPFLYLCVPVYGALLFKYRGEQVRGIVKSLMWIVWMVLPAYLMSDLSACMSLVFMLLLLFSAAVLKDWFQIERPKRFLASFWVCIVLSGPVYLLFLNLTGRLDFFQSRRIRMLLGLDPQGVNYVRYRVLEILRSSRFIGRGDGADLTELVTTVPDFNQSYILSFVAAAFGYAVVIGLVLLFGVMLFQIFRIAFGQKNELGMMISCGCGLVFLTLLAMCFLVNIGLLPHISIYIPFISAGGSNVIVSYILAGIVLSVYRYKSILPKELPLKRKNKKIPKLKFSITLEK
ncbi:MAG: FtsW/RodA/SpoVE family cell cycle protein [Lachnospiraceae bacterium]|nr:FtsW/RodA/SpoVE family cell cycle protein [Lachnospiraceae bacterium]